MAKHTVVYTTGRTVFFLVVNPANGQYYNFNLAAFEAYNAGNFANYKLAAAEANALGIYSATLTVPGTHLLIAYDDGFDQPISVIDFLVDTDGSEILHKPIMGQKFDAMIDSIFAAVAGLNTGVGTDIETYKGITGKNRIVTTFVDGNRSSVTRDMT